MNRQNRLGYTIMGAAMMLIGIAVGLIVSPPLIAQREGVFDKEIMDDANTFVQKVTTMKKTEG